MATEKFVNVDVDGDLQENQTIDSSGGAGDSGKLVSLDADGKLDASFLPDEVGLEVAQFEASEALTAGDYVNIHDVTGTKKVRKADNGAASTRAHGFVKENVASAATATVFFEGTNTALSGLTVPGPLWLGTGGGVQQTYSSIPAGDIVQRLGTPLSATSATIEIEQRVIHKFV